MKAPQSAKGNSFGVTRIPVTINKLFVLLFVILVSGSDRGYCAPASQSSLLREGRHMLTLQWINWDNMKLAGTVQLHKEGNGLYTAKGEQRSRDGKSFLTIDGTLVPTSPRELVFHGTIRTQSVDVNNGKVCEKTGTYHFVAKPGKRYWRLQEMENCEGNHVVDYVDIYF